MNAARLALLLGCAASLHAADVVAVRRVPDGGIKPSAAVDDAGVLHLVYFSGEAKGGDAFYVTSRDGGAAWSAPLRVNSQPRSVLGASSIRGPRLALGRGGRVHVAWNGSSTATPKAPLNPAMPADSPFNGTPLLYTRLDPATKAFEPQRNLMQKTCALDGGSDLAADSDGHVFAVWHAALPGAKGEGERAVFTAISTDDGLTFAEEKNALPEPTGVCACCALAARATDGALAILYRAATDSVHRGMHLLTSRDHGATFAHAALDDWKVATCPMSSASLFPAKTGLLGAWENAGQIYYAHFPSTPAAPPGPAGARKYPAIATDARGETLLAWTEDMGWNKGGAVAWQRFVPSGAPLPTIDRKEGVPANGSVAVVALRNGPFVVLY